MRGLIDIALQFDAENLAFDLALESGPAGADLLGDDGMLTAIYVSLFTDRRAHDDDPLPDERIGVSSDPRGWWGDALSATGAPVAIGSRLWLLQREKEMDIVVARAQEYAAEALEWLREYGYTVSLVVGADRAGKRHLSIRVDAVPDGVAGNAGRSWLFVYDYQNAAPVSIAM